MPGSVRLSFVAARASCNQISPVQGTFTIFYLALPRSVCLANELGRARPRHHPPDLVTFARGGRGGEPVGGVRVRVAPSSVRIMFREAAAAVRL